MVLSRYIAAVPPPLLCHFCFAGPTFGAQRSGGAVGPNHGTHEAIAEQHASLDKPRSRCHSCLLSLLRVASLPTLPLSSLLPLVPPAISILPDRACSAPAQLNLARLP
eukprot:613901-Pyramimonas_sp.AAC.1